MLDPDEAARIAHAFGVAPAQVRRDHVVSHLLAALSQHAADAVVFFGGTALARTLLPRGRLSEDVDLIAVGRRSDVEPGLLRTPDETLIRIQLLDPLGYQNWPTETRELAGQTRLGSSAAEALDVVRRAWEAALDGRPGSPA